MLALRGRVLALAAVLLSACAPADNNTPAPSAASPQRDLAAELAEIDACGYAGCRGPFHSASELDFGAFAMGADVPRALPNARVAHNNCMQVHLQDYGPGEMCGFTMDGVIYVLIDGKVMGKDIDVEDPPAAGLPFDLGRGQTPEETLVSLRAHSDAPFSIKTFPGGDVRYVSNDNVLKNVSDHPFLFYLLFVNERLYRISLADPSAPTD